MNTVCFIFIKSIIENDILNIQIYIRWLCARGNGYLKKNMAAKALEDGKKAQELDSTSVEACILSGKVYLHNQQMLNYIFNF